MSGEVPKCLPKIRILTFFAPISNFLRDSAALGPKNSNQTIPVVKMKVRKFLMGIHEARRGMEVEEQKN